MDLNPRGTPKIGLELAKYEQLREIDPWTWGACTSYSPELELTLTIETAVGATTLTVPALPELCIAKGDVAELASTLTGKIAYGGGLLEGVDIPFAGALLSIPLPDDYRTPQIAGASSGRALGIDEIAITIHLADADWQEDATDVIDISSDKDSTNTDHREVYRLGTHTLGGSATAFIADGSADGRWWAPGDDDARLEGNFRNLIPWEFMDRIANAKPFYSPPSGQNGGDR